MTTHRPAVGSIVLACGVVTCALGLLAVAVEGGVGAAVERSVAADPQPAGQTPAIGSWSPVPLPQATPATPVATPVAGILDPGPYAAALDGVTGSGLSGDRYGVVVDPVSGDVLWDSGADEAVLPASTMKLLTCLAALDLLGPAHRFRTAVVAGADDTIVLVGGGDPYLSSKPTASAPGRASVSDLAARTAGALHAAGTTKVQVAWDNTLFDESGWNDDWPTTYADQVTPVGALVVDQGRLDGTSPGRRTTTPGRDAAEAFVAALEGAGIDASLTDPAEAPEDAEELAAVDSLPLSGIVENLLVHSDNDAAEILAHQVGVAAGTGGSFEGAADGVRQVLTEHDLWDDHAVLSDGSGLSRENRVTPTMLAGAVALAVTDDRYRALLSGLPVGAATGTLAERFGASAASAGRGAVHAKTGTLSGTSALAGYAVGAGDAPVVYAFVVNDSTDDVSARAWLDRAASAVVSAR